MILYMGLTKLSLILEYKKSVINSFILWVTYNRIAVVFINQNYRYHKSGFRPFRPDYPGFGRLKLTLWYIKMYDFLIKKRSVVWLCDGRNLVPVVITVVFSTLNFIFCFYFCCLHLHCINVMKSHGFPYCFKWY